MSALHEARDKRSALEKQITRRLFAGDIGRYPLCPFAQTGIRLVRALIVSLILLDGFRLVDCQGSFFRLCSDLKIPWQVALSEVEEPPWALAVHFREISRLRSK
ncbi:MAG: hypothetical protein BRD43_06245 [Bacteroidetes bacterium QS_4_64_154]|nr:MAG: hypothetical protein BRD43_06245 [Bacteroidetes bacterium QS_4_64_154]